MDFQELMNCFFISKEDNNQVAYDDLLESFKKQNITPIIGAGLSCWVYPLWTKMLKEQAEYYGLELEINGLINENKYEEAASALEKEVTKSHFIRLLQKIFKTSLIEEKREKRPDYLMKLPALFRGPIITTNFDRVIEHLFEICQIRIPDMVIPSDDFQSEKIKTALHQNNPILVKLHGDIEDPYHLVLTKESYDSAYGNDSINPDLELPMPKFLKTVLERNPVLFLGCSLSADRTCTIVQSCAQGVQQFAFLELPKETENKSDPLHPILKDDNGKLLESFKERRNRILGELNITPIWYPYNMHEDAFNAFITKLCDDFNRPSPSCGRGSSINDIKYCPLHKLLGRDDVVEKILEVLSGDEIYCVWVDGPAGIGKTETCKAVHSALINKFSGLNMPYIDLTEISGLSGFFESVANGINVHIPSSININIVPEYLIDSIKQFFSAESSEHLPHIMYFDNWEDIWYGLNCSNEKDFLIQWMMNLHLNKIHTLISSREISQSIPNGKSFHIYPLDNDIRDKSSLSEEEFNMLNSVKLFCDILGRNILPSEYDDFRTLICNLDGHPLSIVLTATQARSEINIGNVLKHWEKAKQDTASTNKKHTNLEIALQMSWNSISRNKNAIIQWGLEYYSLHEIPEFIFQQLCGNSSEEEWNEGLRTLTMANLVYFTQNRTAIAMLLPLKKQFVTLNKDNAINEICLIRWSEYIEKILGAANDPQSDNHLDIQHTVIDLIPQIIFIMEQLLPFKSKQLYDHLDSIVSGMWNYYKFHIQSVEILKKLVHFYKNNNNSHFSAILLLQYGHLLNRLGDVDGAQEAYNEAELLYIKERDDLGLANLLKSRGDLFSRLGDVDGAQEAYSEAESLYMKERDDLGLANLLKSHGDLLSRLGDVDGAQKAFNKAEPLFIKERDELGLANLLRARGDLLSFLGYIDNAREMYNKAEPLYIKKCADLGLANLLRSRGDLLSRIGDVNGAQEAYNKAELLYVNEHVDLGLANLLISRGNLLSRLGDVNGAQEIYNKAERLYIKERDNLGLANLLKSRGDLLSCLGDVDGAKEAYNKAELLYMNVYNDFGLANLLQSRGDLLSRLGDVDGALEAYNKAEPLHIKVHNDFGLALLLLSRSILLSNIGDVDGALEVYNKTKPLLIKIFNNFGLANLLRLRGEYLSKSAPRFER